MNIKRKIATSVGACAVVLGFATPALAAVAYPGGGTWVYGTNTTEVYSNYYHGSKRHRSSTINGYGEYSASTCKGAGVWSYNSQRADPNRTDHAYWSTSC